MSKSLISNSFQAFTNEAPNHSKAWMEAVQNLDAASALDKKTQSLAYISVLAATKLSSGIPFYVKQAKANGASREEIISTILLGLPAVGNVVTASLPIALEAYDNE
jgi:alkylhydroperoxidase/carboxymuconolactone decarboxylase family protein YurZ